MKSCYHQVEVTQHRLDHSVSLGLGITIYIHVWFWIGLLIIAHGLILGITAVSNIFYRMSKRFLKI